MNAPYNPPPNTRRFSGATYSDDRDGDRLETQLHVVFALMRDGVWAV